jgi:hypothetical protein
MSETMIEKLSIALKTHTLFNQRRDIIFIRLNREDYLKALQERG